MFCEVARSDEADIERALDAAHAAAPAWGKTSPAERAVILNKIADRIEENLESIAVAASWDNGKPVRETLNADIPLVVDHFRYFAGAIRAQEGSLSQIDEDTVAYHFHEPLGVVGLIVPWNFPILMATWKLAPALAAGNAVVLKPAEQTPASILYVMSLVGDLLPDGCAQRGQRVRRGGGQAVGVQQPHRQDRVHRGDHHGAADHAVRVSQNLIPVTLELGGKSPNIFFSDVLAAHDDYQDKALEGFTMFALNQGEVCTCPSRSLVQADIYDEFLELAAIRTKAVRQGDPLDTETMIGAQASNDQLEKILSYIEIGKSEGAARRDRRGARRTGWRPVRRLLRAAHDLPGQQQDADLPGGDLRPGGVGDLVHRLRRRHLDRQRHPLRAGCRGVEPRRQHRLPGRARYPGRPGVD